jgi:hypothetical protein
LLWLSEIHFILLFRTTYSIQFIFLTNIRISIVLLCSWLELTRRVVLWYPYFLNRFLLQASLNFSVTFQGSSHRSWIIVFLSCTRTRRILFWPDCNNVNLRVTFLLNYRLLWYYLNKVKIKARFELMNTWNGTFEQVTLIFFFEFKVGDNKKGNNIFWYQYKCNT